MILLGLRGKLSSKGHIIKYIKTQWIIFLAIMPLTLAIFGQLSLISPLANLIAVPWVGFTVLPLVFLGGFVSFVSCSLGKFCLELAETSFELLWPILEVMQALPHATWVNAEASIFCW